MVVTFPPALAGLAANSPHVSNAQSHTPDSTVAPAARGNVARRGCAHGRLVLAMALLALMTLAGCAQKSTAPSDMNRAEGEVAAAPTHMAATSPGDRLDTDGDGVVDLEDRCPATTTGLATDDHGCPVPISLALRVPTTPSLQTRASAKPALSAAAADTLARLGDFLRENPTARAELTGHTSNDLAESAASRLSREHAEAMRRILLSDHGVAPERVVTNGRGGAEPLVSNASPRGRARNWRVEAHVTGHYGKPHVARVLAMSTPPAQQPTQQPTQRPAEPAAGARLAEAESPATTAHGTTHGVATPTAPETPGAAVAAQDASRRAVAPASAKTSVEGAQAVAVRFDTASDTPGLAAREALQPLVRQMVNNPRAILLITGHTDAAGDARTNLELSQRRAEAIRDALVEAGATPSRMTIVARGEAAPVAENDSIEGRGRNRRVEVSLWPEGVAPQWATAAPSVAERLRAAAMEAPQPPETPRQPQVRRTASRHAAPVAPPAMSRIAANFSPKSDRDASIHEAGALPRRHESGSSVMDVESPPHTTLSRKPAKPLIAGVDSFVRAGTARNDAVAHRTNAPLVG